MIFSNSKKDELYRHISTFFDEGGTLGDFYDVLRYYFEDYDLIERS